MEDDNSQVKHFLDRAIAYQCGSKEPDSLDEICCFGLFKEYDYLINSKPEDMDSAFVIEKIRSADTGPQTKDFIKNFKGKNGESSLFIIIDHDLKDAIFYQNGSKHKLIATHLDEQMPELDVKDVMHPFTRSMEEFRSLASCRTSAINGKKISFISVRRDMAKYLQLPKYALDRKAKRDNVSETDLTMLTINHEIGHSVFAKTRPPLPPMYTDYKYSEKNAEECYADLYGAINSVIERKDTNVVRLWADYRNLHTLKNVSLLAAMDDTSSDDISQYLIHDTCSALDAFADYADKKLKNNPHFFDNFSAEDIDATARKFAKTYALDDKQIASLVKETQNPKSGPGHETLRLLKRRKQTYENNGYKNSENKETWAEMIQETRENLEGKIRQKDTDKTERKVEKEFLANLLSESEKHGYNEAFLNAYVITRKKMAEKIETSTLTKNETRMKALETILTHKQDKYKPAVAFHDFMRKTDAAKHFEGIKKKDLLPEYLKAKKDFITNMTEVLNMVNSGKTDDTTAKKFEAALKNTAYTHYLAEQIGKKSDKYPEIAEMLEKDAKKAYPKELDDFYLSNKESLLNLEMLIKKQSAMISEIPIKTADNSKNTVLALKLKKKGNQH